MKQYRYFLRTFSFFIALNINAQEIQKKVILQWNNNSKEVFSSSDEVITLPLLKDKLFDTHFIPYYFKQWKVGSNLVVDSYQIKNIVYQTIDANLFLSESQDYFPEELKATFVVKNARNESFTQLKIIPLVKDGNRLKRVVSFDLVYKLKSKALLKSSFSVHDSPLSSGNWYKFAVETTGVYKIDKSFLNGLGINVGSINPKNIQLYGNGGALLPEANAISRPDGLQENAIFISGEDDNSFDNNDYILFYAQGFDVWIANPSLNKAIHQRNIYSNRAFYFIHVGNNLGKRIQNQIPITNQTANETITTYNDYAVHELDKINLDHFGQHFFGENFTVNDTQNIEIPFVDVDLSQDIQVTFSAAAQSTTSTNFKLNYNAQNIINLSLGTTGSTTIGSENKQSATFTPTSETLNFELKFENNGNPSATAFLDYIEVNGFKKLIARDKQFSFRSFSLANAPITDYKEFKIENANNIHQIWEVTDKFNPQIIENTATGSNFTFLAQGGSLHEYEVLNNTNFYTPIKLNDSRVSNQNLHALTDIDYLIISPSKILGEANRLADYHRSKGLSVLVTTEQTIYNEFSSGAKDPMAIRDFIKHLYFNASTPEKRIKYVLMFGDTSYDFKNINGNNDDINVIAYQSKNSTSLASSYVTDDFFVMLDDNEGEFYNTNGSGDLMDVGIGRMPVKSSNEATIAVNKTLAYYSKEAFGKWRNHISLVADDVDKLSSDFGLEKKVEQVADLITLNKPVYNLSKIYSDAYVQEISSGGQSYPDVIKAINNAVERGSLLIDYFGHGGENGWAAERFLDIPQIQSWYNKEMLPLFITITCEFSRYDNPMRVAAGEHVFSNEHGGSVAMITTAREVYISFGGIFNIDLMSDLLEFNTNDNYSISQSLAKSKNGNASQIQRLFISFFGDPAMKLARPKPNIKITQMNDVDVSQQLDTIKALSHVYFKGIVTDNNDNLLPNFNGDLSVVVFDKSTNKFTLNNDNHTQDNGDPATMEFDSRESKIFNGRATVLNGEWQFDFIASRDIRIAYGAAKLSFYADDEIIDKNGYNTDIIIGGINYDAPEDTLGPKIKLYMNDESFIDGGNTNQNPLFLAILEDESGINTSFTAVDHDIVAILDGDQSNPIIMNDYYETESDNFKKGKVKFPFRDLAVGLHTLTFKCWDTYNNPSEASLSFVVVSDSELVLDHVLNYPNPFINYTEFWFSHNKPNEPLEAQVQIFTVSGKLIKTINQQIQTTGTLARSMQWNGLDDFGNKIGKGVYIYKLKVKTISNGLKAEKVEKLVILQ